jgi:hypothetical protein
MNQRIAIKPFVAQSFDVEVRAAEASACEVWFFQLRKVGKTEDLRPSDRDLARELVEGEMPPVDTLGMLSGDGMWVGGGGVSLLPILAASDSAVNCFQYRAE